MHSALLITLKPPKNNKETPKQTSAWTLMSISIVKSVVKTTGCKKIARVFGVLRGTWTFWKISNSMTLVLR